MTLNVKNIEKHFGGHTAVNGVSLKVEKRTLHSLIGPNGAGKTTLFNLISGTLQPSNGDIIFQSESIVGLGPEERARLGLARSFQVTNVFPNISIRKNIRLALQQSEGLGYNFWIDSDKFDGLNNRARNIADQVGIVANLDSKATTLSHGEKRHLEIGIAIAQEPKLLLLDEPTAGLTTQETRGMINIINDIRSEYTIFLVEHNIDLVMELSDTITVISEGSIIGEGTPQEIRENNQVQSTYLGKEVI
jgi:branched-chain amino acid transport system ATP-binding protein